MKALEIQPARGSMRAKRHVEAPVINISEKSCLSLGIAAVAALFVCLGAMCVPGIIISGFTAVASVALAPSLREKGGEI